VTATGKIEIVKEMDDQSYTRKSIKIPGYTMELER